MMLRATLKSITRGLKTSTSDKMYINRFTTNSTYGWKIRHYTLAVQSYCHILLTFFCIFLKPRCFLDMCQRVECSKYILKSFNFVGYPIIIVFAIYSMNLPTNICSISNEHSNKKLLDIQQIF